MRSNYKGKSGDTDLHFVKDLPKGHSLWRCINAGGTPYSMIVDPHGDEIKSIETVREKRMLSHFDEYLKMMG